MIVIPRNLRVNDPKVVELWKRQIEWQVAEIMAAAARKVAQLELEFSELVRLSEQHNSPMLPPSNDEQNARGESDG